MSRTRILRTLARFDAATVADVMRVVGGQHRAVWHHLQGLVADGLATREGENHVRYSVTEAGRLAARSAA